MKRIINGFFLLFTLFGIKSLSAQQIHSNQRFKREFLNDINYVRQKGCNCGTTYMPPAPPLVWNNQLEIAAMGHAQDMSVQNYFSHTSKDGTSMQNRIIDAGYNFKGYKGFIVGENIAAGQQSITEVMNGWLKSVGHCKNLMNPAFKEVGVAENNDYWVQDFGGRTPFTPQELRMIKSGQLRVIEQ